MKLPRPPGWETNPRIVQGRHLWHRAHLPCPFCLIEGRYDLRGRLGRFLRRG